MRLNIFHRPDPGPLYDVYREEQKLVHELGFRSTIFLYYRDLLNPQAVQDALGDAEQFGDEIGLALHNMEGEGLEELARGLNAVWLLPQKEKREVITRAIAKFEQVIGKRPTSIASYHFDAASLRIIEEIAPEVEGVVGGCFEEGVRVFHGCNHSWYLFNEGMPWGPWYPSRIHSLKPARDEKDGLGIVAVPHLSRDMSLAYEGRNDFWASHPPNVIRGMGNDASFCPYDRNLIDQYRMQEDFNGESYYNIFVGPQWLTHNHNSEYPPEVAWSLYRTQLEYLAELKEQGEVVDQTLTEYATWHKQHHALEKGAPRDIYLAKEMLYGSGKHYFWYIDADQRILVDATQGGSIGDIRAYVGDVAVDTGPDTDAMAIGTYPYLVQSQHRTGYPNHFQDGSRTTLKLRLGGEEVDLATSRTRVAKVEKKDGETVIELTPARFVFSRGVHGEIVTTYRFLPGGRTEITRRVASLSDASAQLELVEYLKGCYGKTEYPEKLHGVKLTLEGASAAAMDFEYRGRDETRQRATAVAADVPMAGTRVALSPKQGDAASGTIREGHLFSPYYTLSLAYQANEKTSVTTCLTLTSI
ncbi:MAG: hypothetical protein ACLFV3_13185 [Phycisphaeraceae bacterium]